MARDATGYGQRIKQNQLSRNAAQPGTEESRYTKRGYTFSGEQIAQPRAGLGQKDELAPAPSTSTWDQLINKSQGPLIPRPFESAFTTNVQSPLGGQLSMSPSGQVGAPLRQGTFVDRAGRQIQNVRRRADGRWEGTNEFGAPVIINEAGEAITITPGVSNSQAQPWADRSLTPGPPLVVNSQAQPWADRVMMPGSLPPGGGGGGFGSNYGGGFGGGGGGGGGGAAYTPFQRYLNELVNWNIS